MQDTHARDIDHTLWQAIRQRARAAGITPEDWLEARSSQADRPAPVPRHDARDEDEALFELTLRHFRELQLSRTEARDLAAAIFAVIEHGEPRAVGPVGRPARRYTLQRRAGALSIRVGEGRISLPLRTATRLATVLDGRPYPGLLGDIAA